MKATLIFENGQTKTLDVCTAAENGVLTAYLKKEELGEGIRYVDFLYDCFTAKAGDEGWFLTGGGTTGTVLTRFTQREDAVVDRGTPFIGCYGMNTGKAGTLAIVTGMRPDHVTIISVKDGVYSCFPRFMLDGDAAYEDIRVELHGLEDGGYPAMARCYRAFQLTRGGCVPLAERTAADPRLKKSADSIAVRVRQGWKPAPSPVEYQTPETEPPMHVACTFDRVGDIADEFRRQGIPGAEFCLVGWNYGGHDGRFPQIFPPDPRLGGEERLRALISHVKEDGYGIVCHDDATGAYTIADCFDEEYLLKNKDGGLHLRPYCWSGGRPHKICPQRQYERFETVNQPKLAALGFEGIHYIDVITILPLLKCYDPKHPLNRAESGEWYRKTMKLARKTFGGFSSESGFDFAASDLDYCMYISFKIGSEDTIPLCDAVVPFWELIYHGIILYNSSTFTLNYTAKSVKNRLKYFEYGGRPLICYYANFASNNNWMGREDFLCDTDEQLRDSAEKIRVMSDDYESLSDVRFSFMDDHEEIAPGVFRTTYSNGTSVTVDYKKETFEIK